MAFVLAAGIAAGDEVVLKNGSRVAGTIESEKDGKVVLRIDSGVMTFRKSEISRIERSGGKPAPEPRKDDGKTPPPPVEPGPEKTPAVETKTPPAEPEAADAGDKTLPPSYAWEGAVSRPLVDEVTNFFKGGVLDSEDASAEVVKYIEDMGPKAIPAVFTLLRWNWGDGAETEIGQYIEKRMGDNPDKKVIRVEQILVKALLAMPGRELPAYIRTLLKDETPLGLRLSIVKFAKAAVAGGEEFLGDIMGEDAALDTLLVAQLPDIVAGAPGWMKTRLEKVGRQGLLHRDIAVRRVAVKAVGRLKDRGAADVLIGLLDSDDKEIRDNALEALQAISGQAFPATPDRWKAWLAESEKE